MKLFPTIADMMHELKQAKIISLAEYRHIKKALGWKPDYDKLLADIKAKKENHVSEDFWDSF